MIALTFFETLVVRKDSKFNKVTVLTFFTFLLFLVVCTVRLELKSLNCDR